MHPVPSLELLTRLFGGSSCSHRLKHRLDKSNRRAFFIVLIILLLFRGESTLFVNRRPPFDIFTVAQSFADLTEKLSSLLIQMDVCSHISFPVNDVSSSIHGFCLDPTFESTYGLAGGFSVDELAFGATKFLNIQDDIDIQGVSSSNTPFPPKDLKPVSAMKGSREKRGVDPPKKLSVKWAPDVYDPVPSLPSDTVISRPRKQHGKKKGTSSSESKSSRGSKSKGKDKKHRKRSGKSYDLDF
ncbi:unnamed protein product [Lactuca saligna]|uniref:Uncharacterized protein n=1 Tax=Lactuca saligna TaxID=75948 RepID=A0AA35ZBV6_LACSI|nr:unnamed protein product [Lactuca saligna]